MQPSNLASSPEERAHSLELQARTALAPSEASSLLCQAADLLLQHGKEPERAQGLLQRAAAIAPQDLEPLKRLRVLYEQRQRHALLAEVLERLAQRTGGAEAATLLFRAAELHEKQLHRPHRAVLCLQLAARADPKRREAFRRVRKVLLADGHAVAAYESLTRERRALGDAGMAAEYAGLAERLLEDPPHHELALRAADQALTLEPGHAGALKVKKTLSNFALTWRDRVRTLRSHSLETQDRKEAAGYSLQVAKLFARFDPHARGKVDEALDRAFLLYPGMPEAAAFVESLAAQDPDPGRAATRLEELAARTQEKTPRAELFIRAGMQRLSRQSNPTRALEDFRQAHLADPSRADSTSLAVELATEQGNPAIAAELLEAHLAALVDPLQAVPVRKQLAALYAGPLKVPQRARAQLEAVLNAAPSELGAALQAAQLAVEAEDADALGRLLPLLDLPGPWKAATELLERCAAVFAKANDPRRAADALAHALLHAPARVELLPKLMEEARRAGNAGLDALAASLRKAAAIAPEPTAAAAVWRALAELLGAAPDRAAEAEAAWREVKRREPDGAGPPPPPAPPTLEELQAKLAALGPTPKPTEALPLWRQLSAAQPEDPLIAKQLATALAPLELWDELAEVTARLTKIAPTPEERLDYSVRLARLYSEPLKKPEEAAAILLARAQAGELGAGVVEELERLAARDVRRKEIQAALSPHYQRSGAHQQEVAQLLHALAAAKKPGKQRKALLQLADLHEGPLKDPPAALGYLLRAVGSAPTDAVLGERAWALADTLKRLPELGRTLAELGKQQDDRAGKATLYARAAEAALQGDALEEAARWADSSLAAKETPRGLDLAFTAALRSARPDDAERHLRRRLLLAEGGEKRGLYLKLAELDEQLGRPGDAATALEEAVRAGEAEAAVLPRLCELYARAGREDAYAKAMARRLERAKLQGDAMEVARLETALRPAADASGAAGLDAALLRLDSTPQDAQALAAVESVLADEQQGLRAARALAAALKDRDGRRRIPALEVLAERAELPEERVRALRELAELQAQLKQPSLALAALARAIRLAPGDVGLLRDAERAAHAADGLDALADVLQELAEAPGASAALHLSLAQVLDKLGTDRAQVLRHLHAARAADPTSAAVLGALVLQHRAHDEWAALAELLESLAHTTAKPEERIASWREAAVLHENRLLDKESAAAAWRQVAESDPLAPDAVLALERLYEELDRPQDLVFALELGRKQAEGTQRGRELTVRLARLRADRLADLPGAVDLCREVLVQDEGNAAAREALESWAGRRETAGATALAILDPLLAQSGDHARRAAMREARLQVSLDDGERERLSNELRSLYERELRQPDRAFMAALRAFSSGIGRERLIDELERLAQAAGVPEEVADIFESAADQLMPGDPQLPKLLRRAAGYREALGELEAATRLWNELLGEAPNDAEALQHLSALYAKGQNAKNLSEVYARQAALAKSPQDRRELLLKSAKAYEETGADEQAISALRGALEVERTADALAALDRLYGRTKRGAEQAEVLAGLVELTPAAAERFPLRVRLGQLEEKLGRPEKAGAAFLAALGEAPADQRGGSVHEAALSALQRLFNDGNAPAAAGEALEKLHRATGERRRLAEVLERLSEREPSVDRYAEIAALRASLGERLAAFAARLRAFSLVPGDEQNRKELERLARELDSPEELAAAYEDRLERGVDAATEQRLWRRLAELHEDLGKSDQAARAWEEAARRAPEDLEPLRALAKLHQRGMAFKELTEVLLRMVALEPSAERKVDLLYEAATVAEDSLADAATAIRCYREVLERAPQEATARKSLERLFAAQGDHAGVAAQLTQELSLLPPSQAERALELELSLAKLKLTKLSAPLEAFAHVERAIARAPSNPAALELLQGMLAQPELSARAAELLESLVAKSTTPAKRAELLEAQLASEPNRPRRAELLRRLAQEQAGPLREPELAFLTAARALRESPGEAACVQQCLELAEAADAREALDGLLEELVPAAPNPEARLLLARSLARLRDRAGEGAVPAWRAVVALAPQDPEALEALERLLRDGTPEELVALLQQRLQTTRAPAAAVELQLRLAAAQEAAGQHDAAIGSLQQAFALQPKAEPLVALERLYGKLKRPRERAEVLVRLADLAPDPAARAKLLLQRAALLEALPDLDGAVLAYGELLDSPSADAAILALERQLPHGGIGLRAARLLEPVLRSRGDKKRLVAALETRLSAADKDGRKALLDEVAQLREEVGQTSLAFAARARAFVEAPGDAQVRAELERLATAGGLLEELAGTYEDVLERGCGEPARTALRRRLAELYAGPLARPADAAEVWREVSRSDPADPHALAALAELHRKANAHEALVEVLLKQVSVEPAVDRQVEKLFEIAELAETALADDELAVDAYQQILERAPTERGALRSLQHAYERTRRFGELADALSREIALLRASKEEPAAHERQVALAQLQADHLNDPEAALATFRSVLGADPSHAGAQAGLEALALSGGAVCADAAKLLEPLLEKQGAHERLVAVLEAHARAEGAAAARAALLRWVAGLQGSALRNPPAAFLAAARALRESPDEPASLELCLTLSKGANAGEELVTLLEELAPLAADPDARHRLLRTLAALQTEEGELGAAIASWEGVLRQRSNDAEAMDALEQLFTQGRRHKELTELLTARIGQEQGERRLELLVRRAQAQELAGDDPGAILSLTEACEAGPRRDRLTALARLLEKTGQKRQQAVVLATLAELPDTAPEARRELEVQRAGLLEELQEAADAAEAYAKILERTPDHRPTVAALRQLLSVPGARKRAAQVLEPPARAAAQQDPAFLLEVLEGRADHAAPAELAPLLDELARLHERRGDLRTAFARRLRLFRAQPGDGENRAALERMADALQGHEELAGVYEDEAEKNAQIPSGVLRRLARLYEGPLSNPAGAARSWEKLAAREEDAPEAVGALVALYRTLEDPPALARALERAALLEKEPQGRLAHLRELAALAEGELTELDRAAEAYRQVLALAPEDPDARAALARIYTLEGSYEALAELILREVDAATRRGAHEEAQDQRVRLARLQLLQLNDPNRGLEILRGVLDAAPNHPGALAALDELVDAPGPAQVAAAELLSPIAEKANDAGRLVKVLRVRAGAAEPVARAALLRSVAALCLSPLEDLPGAYKASAQALEAHPPDEAALAQCLEISRKAGQDEQTVQLLERLLAAAPPRTLLPLRRALARLQESLWRPEQARSAWRALVEAEPGDLEALDGLARSLEVAGASQELLELRRRQLAQAQGPAQRLPLFLKLASLQQQLGDDEAALASLRKALELDEQNEEALSSADRLCERLGRWEELSGVLERRLRVVTGENATALRFRLAEVRETRLSDRTGALAQYRQVLSLAPGHPGTVSRLEGLAAKETKNVALLDALIDAYRAVKDVPRLCAKLEARAALAPDAAEKKRLYLELAEARTTLVDEPELAFLALSRAFSEEPTDEALREKLTATARKANAEDSLAALYAQQLPRLEPAQAAPLHLALAEHNLAAGGEAGLAAAAGHLEACRAAPGAVDELRVLSLQERTYGALRAHAKLAEVLARQISLTPEPAAQVEKLLALAQLQAGPLQAPAQAAASLEQVLAAAPEHLEAACRLEALYATTGDAAKRLTVLALQQRLTSGEEQEKVTFRLAAAQVDAGQAPQAIALYRQILERAPRHAEAFDALATALEKTGQLDALRDALVDRISRTLEPTELAGLHGRVGKLLHRGLSRPEDAIVHLKAAVERAPNRVDLLEELQAIYEKLQRGDDLASVLRRRISLETDEPAGHALRLQLAEVLLGLERQDEALEAARPLLDAFLARGEGSGVDAARLQALLVKLDAKVEQARLLQARAESQLASGSQASREVLHQAAALWLSSSEPERAAPLLVQLLKLAPDDRRAYDAARGLYTSQSAWAELAALVEGFLPHLPAAEQKDRLLELAELYEAKLARPADAVAALCRAVAHTPDDAALRGRLEALAERAGAAQAVAAAYEALGETLPWSPAAEQLWRTLARLYDGPLDDVARAEAALRRILDFDPGNAAALEGLEQLFIRRGLFDRAVKVLEEKLEVTGDQAARKKLLREISRVQAQKLNDPAKAAATLERSLQLAPDVATYSELIELHRQGKRWKDVVATLGRARDFAATAEQRANLQVEIAAVQEQELKDVPGAIASLRQALDQDGRCTAAFTELERLYAGMDKPVELLALYERQLAVTEAKDTRVALLRRCAELCETRQKNPGAAERHLEQLVALAPKDLDALRALTRLKRSLERHADLTTHFERLIPLVPKEEQLELLLEAATLFSQRLNQPERALAVLGRALELDPRHRGALRASAELHERARSWPAALDFLQREIRVLGAAPESADLQARMGRILDLNLKDRTKAKNAFQEALRLAPTHVEATDALLRIYQEEGNWGMYERTLTHRAQHGEPGAPRARALVAVGRFFLERRKDREGARSWFEQAIRADPQCVEAASALADLYLSAEDWLAAERMLDVVVRDLTARGATTPGSPDAAALCAELTRLAEVSQRVGEQPKALKSLESALALNPTYLPALRSLGSLRVTLRQPAEALKIFESLLLHHRAALTPREVADLHVRTGDLHLSVGQRDRARAEFDRALSVDSRLAPALKGLAQVHDATGQADRALEARQRLLPLTEGDERYALCLEIAALAKEKVKNPTLCVEALLQALKVRPGSVEALDKLYVAYRSSHQGARAAETLQNLLKAPEVKADVNRLKAVQVSLAETFRDELRDVERAAAAYNAALDLDWRFVEALRGLEKLYTQSKRWRELEEVYTRMIRRIPEAPDTLSARMTLWRTQGDLQLKALNQPDRALTSYQAVCKGSPEDAEAQELFAQLAAQRPGMEDAAAEAYRQAIAHAANPATAAVGFAELAARRKQYDVAYLAAQACTALLGTSGAGEAEILAKLGPFAKRNEATRTHLTDRLWKSHLLHPKARGPLAELLALLADQLSEKLAVPLSKYDLHPKKHRIELASSGEPPIHALRYASGALNIAFPELYSSYLANVRERAARKSGGSGVFPDVLVGVEICQTHPPALRVGGRFIGETGQKELLYSCGRALALLRPELQLVQRVEPPRLPQLLQAAVWMSGATPPGDLRLLEKERKFLEKALSETGRTALQRVGKQAAAAVADPQALPRYVEGVELTAMRAGALLAGDLQAVKRMVVAEGGRLGDKAKLRDLLLFYVSEDLVALRTALGNSIEIKG